MKRLVLVGVVLALVCAAAGTAAPPSVKAIAAARQRVALRKAESLLRRVPLPAGATRLPHIPVHDLGMTTREAGVSVDTMSAERYGFWRTRQSVAFVMQFVRAHPVWGLTANGGGTLQDGTEYAQFYGRGSPMGRMVVVSAVRVRGRTYIRVDAAVAWIYPRSPKEGLPTGVREIDIRGGGVTRQLTDPAQVARIVRWFGEPTVTPPTRYVTTCSVAFANVTVTFMFRSASGAELARASVPSTAASACDPIQFYVHGRAQTPLIDAGAANDAFISRVERLLAVCFGAGPSGGRRPSPVCNKQWAEEEAAKLLHQFRLPSGAQALAEEPRGDAGFLRSPETVSASSELVDQHRFWKVRLPLAAAEAFVEHEHHARQAGSSTAGGPGIPPNHSVTFTYVPRNGIIASRTMDVTFVTLPHGWTGVRADAQVVWIYPRTGAQMAPPHTAVIVVRVGRTTRRIREFEKLWYRIEDRFDRLEVVQPGTPYHCPAMRASGPKVTVDFHAFNPRFVARAVAPGSGISTACNPIVFSLRGQETELVGGDFVQWLERMLREGR